MVDPSVSLGILVTVKGRSYWCDSRIQPVRGQLLKYLWAPGIMTESQGATDLHSPTGLAKHCYAGLRRCDWWTLELPRHWTPLLSTTRDNLAGMGPQCWEEVPDNHSQRTPSLADCSMLVYTDETRWRWLLTAMRGDYWIVGATDKWKG